MSPSPSPPPFWGIPEAAGAAVEVEAGAGDEVDLAVDAGAALDVVGAGELEELDEPEE
ncbi:MAG TPA: hypothetical protein VGF15_02400 [Solirubrobacteraceae bacterium]